MILSIPSIDELSEKVDDLIERVRSVESKIDPQQAWFTLMEACRLKGVKHNSVKSRPRLQPNHGKEDGIISGRKRWRRETIMNWIPLTDDNLLDS